MSIEDLLKPRKRVLLDYPYSNFEVGQIIEFDKKDMAFFEPYPHIFKDVFWWEERKEEDMPMFLKRKDESKYWEIDKWTNYAKGYFIRLDDRAEHYCGFYLPATKQEYLNQK